MLDFVPAAFPNDLEIVVRNRDCIEQCVRLRAAFPEAKIGLLNMASDVCPGGGVKKGSKAQEEDVCRRTTLYPSLAKHRYPLEGTDMIYSEDVFIIKDFAHAPLDSPIKIDGVLSVPAIRRPALKSNGDYADARDRRRMRAKIRMTLQTAAYHGLDTLVLGAHGLGCFRNPAHEVAGMFADLLTGDGEFAHAFKHVSFAILEPPKGRLCDLFERALGIKPVRAA